MTLSWSREGQALLLGATNEPVAGLQLSVRDARGAACGLIVIWTSAWRAPPES